MKKSDKQLLAGVLGDFDLKRSASILDRVGGLQGLANLTYQQATMLAVEPKITPEQAHVLHSAIQLGRRIEVGGYQIPTKCEGPAKVARFLRQEYVHGPQEQFGAVMMTARLTLISVVILGKGTVDNSLVSARDYYREALAVNAAATICFHNHPSGAVTPSEDDFALTMKLSEAGKIMGVPLEDHIILGERIDGGKDYYSMKENGKMTGGGY